MRVLPILFNTEMVRAILDGRKTFTRRICKDANEYTVPDMDFYNADRRTYAVHNYADKEHMEQLSTAERTCPICPEDILYVRETFAQAARHIFWYRADNAEYTKNILWRPSIHMPKEAARIWLKVTNVRVERLQKITDKDAEQEGAQPDYPFDYAVDKWPNLEHFKEIWNSTIKKSDLDRYGWDANPFVWVVSFERCEKPEVN